MSKKEVAVCNTEGNAGGEKGFNTHLLHVIVPAVILQKNYIASCTANFQHQFASSHITTKRLHFISYILIYSDILCSVLEITVNAQTI